MLEFDWLARIPVSAGLVRLADYSASCGRNPGMVNGWTSNDVPSVSSLDLYNKRPDLDISGKRFGAAVALEAMVEHLNAHYPKPENPEQLLRMCNVADLKRARAEEDADRWRRAYEIVEQERDQARDSLRRLRAETDFDLFTVRDQLKQCRGEREQMTRERDEVQERADQLRDERDEAVQSCITVSRARDEWQARAEAAEARTAPSVTRAEVEKVVRGQWGGCFDGLTDAVWSLVSGADPAIHVVRESDVADVEVVQGGNWRAGTTGIPLKWTAQKVREMRDDYASEWIECEAIARAIEAEQATDQVEAKAREYLTVMFDYEEPDSASPAEWKAATQMARHVLGQEEGDE